MSAPSWLDRIFTPYTVQRAKEIAQSPYGTSSLAFISFVESFLPAPILTDPFLVGAILVNRLKAYQLVVVTTVSSVLGGFAAYIFASLFRDWLMVTASPEVLTTLNDIIAQESNTFLLTILGAVTPVPYTLVAWAVALSGGHPMVFILASLVGRLFRYSIVGWCTYRFGPAALQYAKHSIIVSSVVIFIFLGLYIWLKM